MIGVQREEIVQRQCHDAATSTWLNGNGKCRKKLVRKTQLSPKVVAKNPIPHTTDLVHAKGLILTLGVCFRAHCFYHNTNLRLGWLRL